MPGVSETARRQSLPAGTMLAIVLAACARAGGEMVGYAGLMAGAAAHGMHRYEVHKLKFVGPDRL